MSLLVLVPLLLSRRKDAEDSQAMQSLADLMSQQLSEIKQKARGRQVYPSCIFLPGVPERTKDFTFNIADYRVLAILFLEDINNSGANKSRRVNLRPAEWLWGLLYFNMWMFG
eukprot:1139743-Pelagomonas_calceolata.AAC.3